MASHHDFEHRLVESEGSAGQTRTYFANGALRTEVSTAGGYDSLAYGYDAVGARTRFIHRNETGRTDSVRYTYDAHGDLDQLTVRWDAISSAFQSARTFDFGWDALGRRASVIYPSVLGGMSVTYAYDAMGTLRQLDATNLGNGGNTDALTFTLTNDSVGPAGRILHQRMECDGVQSDGNPCGGAEAARTTANEYNRLGWLVEQAINADVDLMRYDASGNLRWKQHTTWNPDSFYVAPHSNRVTQVFKGTGATDSIVHELDGSRRSEWSAYTATRAYFYDGRGRTSGIRSWVQLPGLNWQFIGNPGTCGYDPLGRAFRACASAATNWPHLNEVIMEAQNWYHDNYAEFMRARKQS